MARYEDAYPVDLVIVGAGAGGGTLAQRLARRGWKVAVLEPGPFWDPDEDWVSDEAGSHRLYWTDDRLPAATIRLSSARTTPATAGGVRWSTTPATARAFILPTSKRTPETAWGRTGRSPTRPKKHYERLELELPVPADFWPWGEPHRYPHTPTRSRAARNRAVGGARKLGSRCASDPSGSPTAAFGNRPHCIYRGFCLQGCKVNAKASPLVTHIPDAIEHGAEIRAHCMVTSVEVDDSSG